MLGVVLLVMPLPATAEKYIKVPYIMGTGFFVNSNGYLLTSNHVVTKCVKIYSVEQLKSQPARIIARDADLDIALLKVDVPTEFVSLSSLKQPLKKGDDTVIIGFPGDAWKEKDPIVREAHIIDSKGPRGEEKWLQFDDVVEKGNSGGPLFDASGNVVGMIAAQAREISSTGKELRRFNVAISLPAIREFLARHNIDYDEVDSGVYIPAGNIADHVRESVVNIRCREK